MTYNGHKNWNHWNVALWLGNDYGLYSMVQDELHHAPSKDEAARRVLASLREMGIWETPDGAPYSFTSIRASMTE